MNFQNKVVVVTGAGSGIGRETVFSFARRGAKVVAVDINPAGVEETAALADGRVEARVADVSSAAAMESLADEIERTIGVPDVVVNNAGIAMTGSFFDHTVEDWDRILGVNVYGVIHGCRLFGAQMIARGHGGHIVNVASAAGYTPTKLLPAYCTTKSAVLMLSECLDAELSEHGIGVTAICPGLVDTPITTAIDVVGATNETRDEFRAKAQRGYHRRNYPPSKVAEAIVAAVEKKTLVAPVTIEAHLMRLVDRTAPDFVRRRIARFDASKFSI